MKLYNLDHSPYASRVRTQIRKKGLDVEFATPPVELRTPEFNQRFPLGKIPVLELDDGSQLPDSWVIMEYLEEVMPGVSLCPEGATARAHMQLLARYCDTYLSPGGLFPLFQRVGNPGDAQEALAGLDAELARLQRLLEFLPDFRQRELHLGDIALAPAMDYVHLLGPLFGVEDPTAAYPQVARWWQWVCEDEAVRATSEEMRAAVAKLFGG